MESFDRSRELYIKMMGLAIEQKRLIEEGKFDDFAKMIIKRERIQQEISHVDRRYGRILKQKNERDTEERSKVLSLEIADVIRSIQEVDQKIEELLLKKKDDLLNNIHSLRKGKSALRKYGVKNHIDPRFIDRQG